jgi:hypothetical protein
MFVIRLLTQCHVPRYDGMQNVLLDWSENTDFAQLPRCVNSTQMCLPKTSEL